MTEPALPVLALDGQERDHGATPFPASVAFVRLRERGLRTAVVVGLDRGGQAAALAERGADVVVTDLSDLILEGAVARGGR